MLSVGHHKYIAIRVLFLSVVGFLSCLEVNCADDGVSEIHGDAELTLFWGRTAERSAEGEKIYRYYIQLHDRTFFVDKAEKLNELKVILATRKPKSVELILPNRELDQFQARGVMRFLLNANVEFRITTLNSFFRFLILEMHETPPVEKLHGLLVPLITVLFTGFTSYQFVQAGEQSAPRALAFTVTAGGISFFATYYLGFFHDLLSSRDKEHGKTKDSVFVELSKRMGLDFFFKLMMRFAGGAAQGAKALPHPEAIAQVAINSLLTGVLPATDSLLHNRQLQSNVEKSWWNFVRFLATSLLGLLDIAGHREIPLGINKSGEVVGLIEKLSGVDAALLTSVMGVEVTEVRLVLIAAIVPFAATTLFAPRFISKASNRLDQIFQPFTNVADRLIIQPSEKLCRGLMRRLGNSQRL